MTAESRTLAAEFHERWEKSEPPLGLPKRLFWDCMPDDLDLEANASFIIGRAVERGGLEDWKAVRRHYGDEKMKQVVTKLRSLCPKSVNLCCLAFDLEPKDFQCCTLMPSRPAPWTFYDVHALIGQFSLPGLLEICQKKFPKEDISILLRSLACFVDAEEDANPVSPVGITWPEVKRLVAAEVKKLP